ncbi:MAG: hypothetical protein JWR18_881 [Segetibacter sp.]|jgi:hypothetical protein|nr:hypothetical protein [Segetibacter sp.]
MNIENLNELPDWEDDEDETEEGEGWKTNTTRIACKALYEKWNQIMIMLTGALGTIKEISETGEEADFVAGQKAMILGDAYEVGAKIRSSEAASMFVLKMENAAIIRKNAQFVKSALLNLVFQNELDEEHAETLRNEIDDFRQLFKNWVNSFERDEYTDEWGLFT